MINYKFYTNKDHYDDARFVREKVFIEEQQFSTDEDDIDNNCTHVVFYDNDLPFATGRVFLEGSHYIIGRVCVLKEYRGKGHGIGILKALENKALELGGSEVHLGAQCRAKDFYINLGYQEYGDIYYDEYCPHIHMKKNLVNI